MDKKRRNYFLGFSVMMVMMLLAATQVKAQERGRWEKLGERSVNLTVDKDIIRCAHKGTFRAIRFHVEKAPVTFLRVTVEYANGSTENLKFSQLVPAGGTSRYLDLRGQKRIIKQITIYYKAGVRFNGKYKKAKVEVWGRH